MNLKVRSLTGKAILAETFFLMAYVLFVLIIFQPFGTHEYTHPLKLIQLSGYGLLIMVFYPFLKKSLLVFFIGREYLLKSEALVLFFTFFAIIFISFFYYSLAIQHQVEWNRLSRFFWFGIIFVVPPYAALLYRAVLKAQKDHNQEGQVKTNDKLEIKGVNQYEHFYFKASDVFYLRSNGNYVMVYFEKDGELKRETIRNTLGQITSQLSGTDFTPIHRSFMVNARKFDKLLREGGKHVIVNQKFDIRLPVSRNNVAPLEQKLKDHS